ncbi:unnamed protein product [Caenorhabditis auriculariae]|uniref:SSD domain-containing protein n=1 Tax=Caenorhabditis auriculariae TaxID=2777116 RepID=A0A8S1HL73_9PELO|nr:unnamed protein product [Caenorhabditis auriculariae]
MWYRENWSFSSWILGAVFVVLSSFSLWCASGRSVVVGFSPPAGHSVTPEMKCKKVFEELLRRLFLWLGTFIGRSPLAVVLASLAVTAVLSVGLLWFEEVNNVRTEYSPMNSPSRQEYEVAKAFLNQNGTLDPSYVMVLSRDNGSLLRQEYRERLIEFVKTLQNNVTVEFDGRVWDFRDLCEPYCELNTAFLAFLKLYDKTNPTSYTYPRVDIFGTQAFIDFLTFVASRLIAQPSIGC